MSQDGDMQRFSRQDLRKATQFIEGDYEGINPRGFYRKLKRGIEEIQGDDGFKYRTTGNQEDHFEIDDESVGRKTGTVEGRLQGYSDWEPLGVSEVEYRPYGSIGAGSVVIGLLFLVLGVNSVELGLLGVAMTAGGGYGYMQTETDAFSITRQDVVRVLTRGEVSERTITEDEQKRTDMFAEMSVVFAVDAFVRVDTSGFDSLDNGLRRRLVQKVCELHNEAITDPESAVDTESGFVWQLKGITDRSVSDHRSRINGLQTKILSRSFEDRIRYTHVLEEELTTEVQRELDAHEEDLVVEMQKLAQELDIYIEREGYQETDRVQNLQEQQSRPQIEGNPDDSEP